MVKLISITPDAEKLMCYCARVSSTNQDNPDYEKLLEYCFNKGHWSVFEMADMTLEINTSRAISAQLLRHSSFVFQEFSQRYSKVKDSVEVVRARRQDTKNRQNSIDSLGEDTIRWFNAIQLNNYEDAYKDYMDALDEGICKEQARLLLPIGASTKLYMKGNIRSWLTYLMVRMDKSTQLEHRLIANQIFDILKVELPLIASLLQTKLT